MEHQRPCAVKTKTFIVKLVETETDGTRIIIQSVSSDEKTTLRQPEDLARFFIAERDRLWTLPPRSKDESLRGDNTPPEFS